MSVFVGNFSLWLQRKASKRLPFEIDLLRLYDIKNLGFIWVFYLKVVLE